MNMESLIGKTITGCTISDDRERLTIETDQGRFSAEAFADCCSQSWIEHFDAQPLIGGTVQAVNVKCIDHDGLVPSHYPDNQQEVDEQNFYEIVTEQASETIEMRNSSNGYYGGWLELREDG